MNNAPPPTPATAPSAWTHASALIGGLVAIGIGALDLFLGHQLGVSGDVTLMGLGFAALGVKASGAIG